MKFSASIAATALIFFAIADRAEAELCNPAEEFCGFIHGHRSSGSPAKPSTSNTVRLNPSAVPTEKTLGIEGIHYKGEVDFSLIKGLGRVGAAISPSNSEETFFGPPGIEHPESLRNRKVHQTKFPSQKLTLATGFNLYKHKGSGLKKIELNVGVLGKYNRPLAKVTPGGGLSLIVGPINLGYAVYQDQTQVDYSIVYLPEYKPVTQYRVSTASAGIYLGTLALDYSMMELRTDFDVAQITLWTASLILKRGIFTVATRSEDSTRAAFNYETGQVDTAAHKTEYFGGAQIGVGSHVMIGAFYNYYLLREYSLAAFFFF